jgi:hypothetical protein
MVLFIPLYNFVLLLEKGVDESNAESLKSRINGFDFLKLLFFSIVIGLVNLLLACVLPDHNTSFYHDYVLLIYCACLIPLSLIIFPLLTVIFKKKITRDSLFNYFLLFLFFSSIITFLLLQS